MSSNKSSKETYNYLCPEKIITPILVQLKVKTVGDSYIASVELFYWQMFGL